MTVLHLEASDARPTTLKRSGARCDQQLALCRDGARSLGRRRARAVVQSGSDLGLAICSVFVQSMAGEIHLDNRMQRCRGGAAVVQRPAVST